MRIAYVILAQQLPEQLVRLVRRLHSPGELFLLHITAAPRTRSCAPQRTASPTWASCVPATAQALLGGFGHVAATVEVLEEIHRSAAPFDYVALLTVLPPARA